MKKKTVPAILIHLDWIEIIKSNKSPYRIVAGNTAFYGALQAYKQLDRNWTLLAEWHDMFYGQRSAALAGIRFGF